jgi:hypothetical protein
MDHSELARVVLPAAPESIRQARSVASAALDGLVSAELHDDALVVITELSSNAMLHAATPFEVVVTTVGAGIRVEVHDGAPELPRRKRYSAQATTGRGLVLVEALTTVAGADQTETGKVVWAVLSESPPVPPIVRAEAAAEAVVDLAPALALDGGTSPSEATRVAAQDDTWDLRAQAWCEQHRLAPV